MTDTGNHFINRRMNNFILRYPSTGAQVLNQGRLSFRTHWRPHNLMLAALPLVYSHNFAFSHRFSSKRNLLESDSLALRLPSASNVSSYNLHLLSERQNISLITDPVLTRAGYQKFSE